MPIEEPGSNNGTFVGRACVTGTVTLREGDTLRLGGVAVTFCAGASERPTQSMREE